MRSLACFLVVGVVVAASACSDEEEDGAAPGTEAECPTMSDGPCRAGCNRALGVRLDAARGCRTSTFVIVGCHAPARTTTDGVCQVRADGVLVVGSGSLSFARCDDEQRGRIDRAPMCPETGDAGTFVP